MKPRCCPDTGGPRKGTCKCGCHKEIFDIEKAITEFENISTMHLSAHPLLPKGTGVGTSDTFKAQLDWLRTTLTTIHAAGREEAEFELKKLQDMTAFNEGRHSERELSKAQAEYIEFLLKYVGGLEAFAAVHGLYASEKDKETAKELRAKIEGAKI